MFTLTRVNKFPAGTEVDAYEAGGHEYWPGSPPGASIEQQTMAADGATFTDLERGKRYFFAAEIDDEWVVIAATAGADAQGGVLRADRDAQIGADWTFAGDVTLDSLNGESLPIAVSGVRDDPEAALKNLLAALDAAGLIDDSTTETT